MDIGTIFWIGLAIAILWWLFSKEPEKPQQKTVTYTDVRTGEVKKESRKRRQPQNNLTIEKPEGFQITSEIKEILDILENTNQNIFLTGKAGTGKSTLLRYFRATTEKSPVVVAPTGIAAVNVQGQTIHSFFRWGITITPEQVRKTSFHRSKIYRKMQMLIIDEISMVRADIFDCIDKFLRLNTGKPDQPFGGVQIVVIGDLYQLPPVVKGTEKKLFETRYSSPFFFSTNGYSGGNFKKFELGKVFRQKDQEFVSALNAIREGAVKKEHIELINKCVIHTEPEDFEDYVNLVTTNRMAKEINDSKMSRLPSNPTTYKGILTGTFKERDAPTEPELTLKSGAKVMLLNNDKKGRWVNGDIVKVLETNPNSIMVEFDDQSVDSIEQFTWETVRFTFDEEEQKIMPKIVGSFTQIPTKPAWAMTIHKAQGQTFSKLFVDLSSGTFAEGQTYVALSRSKSLDGLKLASPLMPQDVSVNEKVRNFMAFAHEKKFLPKVNLELGLEEINSNSQEEESKVPRSNNFASMEEFTLQSIKRLRIKKYKGIHVVYSGFNDAFRKKFNQDPVKFIKDLENKGVVVTHLVRGGVMLYDAKDMKPRR